jgi:hypothetical protein
MRFQGGIYALLLIAAAGLAAVEGCSLVTSYDGFRDVNATTCGDRVPANSAKPSGTAGDRGPLVGAARTFRFSDVEGGVPLKLGLDLDENCDRAACEPNAGGARALGVDNVLGAFIGKLNPGKDISIDAIKHGQIGLVVQVSGWNGTKNDNAVAVSLFNVAGINGSADGGAEARNDGEDIYIPRDTDLQAVPVAKVLFTSSEAYVSQQRLVARFAEVRLRIITPTQAGIVPFELSFVDAAVVGTITPSKGGIEMPDAQLVGRVRDTEILRTLSNLGLCSKTSNYSPLKEQLCGVIDLTDSKNTDGKSRPCTSGSLSVGLDIAPAKVSAETAPAPLGPYQCPTDPPDNCGGR